MILIIQALETRFPGRLAAISMGGDHGKRETFALPGVQGLEERGSAHRSEGPLLTGPKNEGARCLAVPGSPLQDASRPMAWFWSRIL